MKYNYKKENYPESVDDLTVKINGECKNLFLQEAFKIDQLFTIKSNSKKYRSNLIISLINNDKEIKGLYAFKDE